MVANNFYFVSVVFLLPFKNKVTELLSKNLQKSKCFLHFRRSKKLSVVSYFMAIRLSFKCKKNSAQIIRKPFLPPSMGSLHF